MQSGEGALRITHTEKVWKISLTDNLCGRVRAHEFILRVDGGLELALLGISLPVEYRTPRIVPP
jgi:hypothetical protein